MADDTSTSFPADEGQVQGGRNAGGRGAGNREQGGFRIRLSDNELRAARAVQEAFRLRSTVAALGFSIRTIAQLLEDGQLDGLVAQQRAQAGSRDEAPRGVRRGEGRAEGRGEGRGERRSERPPRVDPFARPARPAPAAASEPEPEAEADLEPALDAEAEPIGSADGDGSSVAVDEATPAAVEA